MITRFTTTICAVYAACSLQAADKPNIVILYADDLGYGDLTCYNPDSKIPTPHLDKLAAEGMRFTDGHSSSGICTPSRYALLTGRHHWRKFHGIVNALGKSVFSPERLTLPEMLQEKGYTTACIGKWHLGWDWDAIRKPGTPKKSIQAEDFDWSKSIPDGPLGHGFDYYFGDAVINFPPYTWIENDKVLKAPDTTLKATPKGATKEGRWEARPGPACSDWDFYENLPTLTEKAAAWLKNRKGKQEPFFLYFPLPSPHAPIVPTDEFDGKSQAGAYGDFVVQTDWSCGQLLQALEESGHAENTIVIFSSDNGAEHYAYARDEKFGHWSSHPLRGLKRDIYEGGHRVPYIVRWPGKVAAGIKLQMGSSPRLTSWPRSPRSSVMTCPTPPPRTPMTSSRSGRAKPKPAHAKPTFTTPLRTPMRFVTLTGSWCKEKTATTPRATKTGKRSAITPLIKAARRSCLTSARTWDRRPT